MHTGEGKRGTESLSGDAREPPIIEFFARKDLHDWHGGKGLFDELIEFAFGFLLQVTAFHHGARVAAKNKYHEGDNCQGKHRQRGINTPEDREHRHQADDRGDGGQQRVFDNHRGARAIRSDPANVVTDRLAGMKVEGELNLLTRKSAPLLGKRVRR